MNTRKPPRLFVSPLTKTPYIVTAYSESPSGVITANTKHECKADLLAALVALGVSEAVTDEVAEVLGYHRKNGGRQ